MADCYRLPEKIEQVTAMLQDKTWCSSYVFHLRWPEGFICPFCGRHQPAIKPDQQLTCPDCGKSSSLTSGTLMHGSKKPLSDWLLAIWWLCKSTDRHKIKDLQQLLCLGSYQTAWTWMQKLRCGMELTEQKKCKGPLEIDCSTLSLPSDGEISFTIVAVIEIRLTDWSTGRVRMAPLKCLTPEAIEQFMKKAISPGSLVLAPDKEPFRSLTPTHYLYTVERGRLFHENLSTLFAHFNQWRSGKYRRLATMTQLQDFLVEFSFYINSKLCISRQLLFENLLRAILQHTPVSYHTLVTGPAPAGGSP